MSNFNCKECGKVCKSFTALKNHIHSHKIQWDDYVNKYNFIVTQFKCKICGKEIPKHRMYCSNKCKFSDTQYNINRAPKIKNDKTKSLECKLCGHITSDIYNLGGHALRHLKTHNIDDSNYMNYYNLIDAIIDIKKKFKCPIDMCDWTSYDLNNSSGWFTRHLKEVHNLDPYKFCELYPTYKHLWQQYFINIDRNIAFTDDDNFIICKICGNKFKFLSNTHLASCGITQKQYKQKYGNIISVTTHNKLSDSYKTGLALYKGHYISKAEIEIHEFLISNGITTISQSNRSIINPYEIDIYLPDYNLAIEYNGLYWHSELGGKGKEYHLHKTELCESKGIQLIHIFEDEWINKKDIIKNKILHILKLNVSKKIFARKCNIKEISSKDKDNFLIKYHLQGKDKSSIFLGAFYDTELIAVMTFGSERISLGKKTSTINMYELMRYASNYNYNCVGVASKLLSHFIKSYNPNKIISYCDRRWSIGNLYNKLGFNKISDGTPNYWYIKNYSSRLHRFNFPKYKIVNKMGGVKELNEWENMQLLGYDRIWDCGSYKFEMVLNPKI